MQATSIPLRHHVAGWMLTAALTIITLAAIPHVSAAPPPFSDVADPDIIKHVEREIRFDPAVPFDPLDVSSAKGVVTLTGSVDNLLAKERATRIAQTVRGVRSVVNRIKVEPDKERSVEDLRKAVKDALLYDTATESYEIDVVADGAGNVTLGGTVDSWQERELAETVTKSVSGVTGVGNNIQVKHPSVRLDPEIRNDIERKLFWDTLVDNGLIVVRVDNGKVFLSGTVGSAAEKERAEWDAWVSGVKTVDSSDLKVEKWARDEALRKNKYATRSDLQIREAVQDALLADPRVSAFKLEIKASKGWVTLQGVVDNLAARQAAVRDAENTVGVLGITNLIKVRPLTKLDDAEIAANIRNALARNPYTEGDEIIVSVRKRVAHLDGVVDSYFEKAEAENVAFRAVGVARVRNNLKVLHPEMIVEDPYVYSWSIAEYPWYEGVVSIRKKTDSRIREDIKDEMMWSPFVDADQVTVSVLDGVAILSGTVDSWGEFRAAQENAFEGGAISVVNKLKVE